MCEQFRKALYLLGFIGAPGTIRTCDRLVRSPPHIPQISITCARFLWGIRAVSRDFFNNLREFMGVKYGSVCSGIEAAAEFLAEWRSGSEEG